MFRGILSKKKSDVSRSAACDINIFFHESNYLPLSLVIKLSCSNTARACMTGHVLAIGCWTVGMYANVLL